MRVDPCEGGARAVAEGPGWLDTAGAGPEAASSGPSGTQGPRARRLCLLGGESAGKTTLAQALSRELGAPHVAEYGRELWLRVGGTFSPDLLLEVAREQVRREDEMVAQACAAAARRGAAEAWVVCDTSALTTLVYCLLDHGDAPAELQALARRAYDLTVVCALDFAFVQDGARRDAGFSARQQALTLQQLREFGMPWIEVSGSVEARLRTVRAALATLGQTTRAAQPAR